MAELTANQQDVLTALPPTTGKGRLIADLAVNLTMADARVAEALAALYELGLARMRADGQWHLTMAGAAARRRLQAQRQKEARRA